MHIDRRHSRITIWLLLETISIQFVLVFLANWIHGVESPYHWLLYVPVLIMQGLWFDRIYVVGHEASHRKIVPGNKFVNDLLGTMILLPIIVPIRVYRKIHDFHHGFNRMDPRTSALDTFVTKRAPGTLAKAYYYCLWFIGVFMGGYFIHSLISVLIFLFLPTPVARRISPAFKGWKIKDALISWLQFAAGVGLHVGCGVLFGWKVYILSLGAPLLAFAWIWSMLMYIFHYRTSIGKKVSCNVRRLDRNVFFSWLLLNFNEHVTHHQRPSIPWYELPGKRKELPEEYSGQNQQVKTIWQAILHQFKGPVILYEQTDQDSDK